MGRTRGESRTRADIKWREFSRWATCRGNLGRTRAAGGPNSPMGHPLGGSEPRSWQAWPGSPWWATRGGNLGHRFTPGGADSPGGSSVGGISDAFWRKLPSWATHQGILGHGHAESGERPQRATRQGDLNLRPVQTARFPHGTSAGESRTHSRSVAKM